MSSDDSQKTLSLIATPIELEPRNYFNTAGKNKEYFPTEPRPESIPTFNKQGRVIHEPADEWWINSEEHHFCFWEYLRKASQPDGTMEPLLQSEIADLFGCSSTKVHFMLKEAMDRLTSDENMQILQHLLELTVDESSEDSMNLSTLTELNQSDEQPE
jgi:hypothetical protein